MVRRARFGGANLTCGINRISSNLAGISGQQKEKGEFVGIKHLRRNEKLIESLREYIEGIGARAGVLLVTVHTQTVKLRDSTFFALYARLAFFLQKTCSDPQTSHAHRQRIT